MNVEQLSDLARRADRVGGDPEGRLEQVHQRIRTARRRRTTGVLVGVGALVIAAAVGAGALTRTSSDPGPEPAPRPDEQEPGTVSMRELTWADEWWPSRTIHHGDTVIDARPDLPGYDLISQLDVSDDGVVATTRDGRIWLVDTESVEHIGTTGPPSFILPGDAVDTGNAGLLVTWIDPRGEREPMRVVFDTHQRRVVARTPCPLARFGQTRCDALWVGTDRVYYVASVRRDDRVDRLDVATGQVTRVTATEYLDDLRIQPRNLVVGDSFDTGEVSDGIDVRFVRRGSRLVATVWPDHRGASPPPCGTDLCETSAFSTSGSPIRLHVPDGYDGARSFTTFQWLDDDRLALMGGAGSGFVPGIDGDLPMSTTGYGDIIVCRISTGECQLRVPGPRLDGTPGDTFEVATDDLRIVPDFGPIGTN